MRKIKTLALGLIIFTSCVNLDLNPLSYGSSDSWYSTAEEVDMSLNGLYKNAFIGNDEDEWTDDYFTRNTPSPLITGTLNSQTDFVINYWILSYKAIERANAILEGIDKAKNTMTANMYAKYKAEALFIRAYQYSRLISHFGDVPYYTNVLTLEESFSLKRIDKNTILRAIYEDFDSAATYLPTSYSDSEIKRATRGAAYALKARIALYMGDYSIARDAAKACMDLNVYDLNTDFETLFLSKTKNAKETVFGIPRSIALGYPLDITRYFCMARISRNAGGYCGINPSWELFCSFLCSDGMEIDKSPLFDPHNPFQNRDPRCTVTIAEFQTPYLGFMFNPHPDSLKSLNFSTNVMVDNKDCRSVNQYASYNGMVWKKGVDKDWLLNGYKIEPDKIIIRYADVLLIFAEAKIELNETDQEARDAINKVRARAYKVNYTQTTSYPEVVATSQSELRKIIRTERRMEFAFEGLRYMDLIRWKLAGKALNRDNFGLLDPTELLTKVVSQGLWFFPLVPVIDSDGLPDFSSMYSTGLIKQLSIRTFNESRQYLWPIPLTDILTNKNLTQNPNY